MAVIHRWKAGDLALANGAAVASVPDGIGTFPLAQATGANQPTFKTNALGANPSIVSAAGKFLRTATLPATANFTFIFVVKSTDVSAVNSVFAQLHNAADRLVIDKRSTNEWSYFGGAAHQIIASGAVGAWQVIGFTGADIAQAITVGGNLSGIENFIGEWIECELHDTQLSAPDLATAISAKQTAYGIAGGGNTAPTANAGIDQTITLPAVANLTGAASDDNFGGSTLTTVWSKFSGAGTVTFGNANALTTTATFSAAGVYVLRLTASDGTLSAADDASITVNAASGSNPENIFFEVDSYFEGQQTTSTGTNTGTAAKAVPHRVALLYGDAGSFKGVGNGSVAGSNAWLIAQNSVRNILNLAVGGRQTGQGTTAFDTEVTPLLSAGVNKMVFLGGANDSAASTPSQILAAIAAYKVKCDTAGMVFHVATWMAITTGLNNQAAVDAYMADLAGVNPGIVAAYPANRVIRFDRHTQLQDPTVFTVLNDGVHPNDAAQPIMAAIVKQVLDGTYTAPAFSTAATLAPATSGTATTRILATTGASVTTWQFKSGTLPTGMTFDAALGKFVLSTAVAAGTYSNLVIWAIDANNHFDERAFSIVVNAAGGDVTLPTGSITSPVSSQVVSGTVSLTANAADNVAVASVQFKIDGVNVGIPDLTAPYSVVVNTTTLTDGVHAVSALITDTAATPNTFTTPAVSFTVNNAPAGIPQMIEVAITAPDLATGVRLKRTTDNLIDFELIRDLANVAVFNDRINLEVGKTYYYRAATRNANGVYSEYGVIKSYQFANG